MNRRVGIEALAVAIPERYVSLADLAIARDVEPSKYTSGLGAKEMAVVDPGEDTVALAATAASRLIRAHQIDLSRVGLLVVGTETAVDHSKAVASFVQGLLGAPRTMRTFDTQHACFGGTAALMAATDWIAAGHANGRAALVICADIARYGLRTPGEPTQGAGAIAMLISERPHLFALDLGVSGAYSSDVHDFWRPLQRREAMVDGHYSVSCYLEALAGSYRAWRLRARAAGLLRGDDNASQHLARVAYHVPFCKMARKAHVHLRRCELEDGLGRSLDDEELAAEERRAAASFEEQVAPSLYLAGRVGNAYTASLYFGLASLLHLQGAELRGRRVGLFSYGSGCSSEFFSGVVGDRAPEIIAAAGIEEQLAARRRVDVAEYEFLMRLSPSSPPRREVAAGSFRFTGAHDERRTYVAGPSM